MGADGNPLGAQVLVVEDEPALRELYAEILEGEGHEVTVTASLAEGTRAFERELVDVVLCDLRLPDGEGTTLLKHARSQDPEVEVILITAYGSVRDAVEAMKIGAADYLTKPLSSPDELRRAVRQALDRIRVRRDAARLRSEELSRASGDGFLYRSAAMAEAVKLADSVARTDATVLILGESGTGKEVMARFIHELSRETPGPFVAVNCAAIPDTLIESELFGHERGAFTGAVERRVGRFEQACGGSLFLDEIGDLKPELQVKLLRVLQERAFERVGGRETIRTDARVLAATHRTLEDEVREGRFREDLFYRLSVFPIQLPPLRARPDDVLPLARAFLARAAARYGRPARELSEGARARLLTHAYPGNVRELQNIMERAVILTSGVAVGEDVIHLGGPGPGAGAMSAGQGETGLLDRLERETIFKILDDVGGNRRQAARVLGISLRTLQYRLKEYGK